MNVRATAKFVPMSPRKVSLVAGLIRGKNAGEALHLLAYTNKRAAAPVGKVLASAMANATNNHGARERDLVVEQVLVGPGPRLKRIRPRARGSASAILHPMSHITVVLNAVESKAAGKPEAGSSETKQASGQVAEKPKKEAK